MNLTKEQQKAIYTHDRNLIVVAGAGSGKTRVLVERYLALLEANPTWRLNQLVAITFTKKAAGEMRDRVRQTLESRLHETSNETERQHWAALLATMDSARIDTIHGLCATILRANAAEAMIDPAFDVLDETEASILLDDVVDDVLRDLAESESPILELFREYRSYQMRGWLNNASLLNADLSLVSDDPMVTWQRLWAEEVILRGKQFLSVAHKIGTPMLPMNPLGDTLGARWDHCLTAIDRISSAGHEFDVMLNALETIKAIKTGGKLGKADFWGDEDSRKQAHQQLSAIRRSAQATFEAIGDCPSNEIAYEYRARELLPLWRDLIQMVRARYQDVKAQASLLDFDDLEALTSQLLTTYPHVRERYRGMEFRHLLVDEFQDTNAAQWQIIKALGDLNTQGSLFVVGDEKQSIYAFRGADVSVFDSVRQEIPDAGGEPLTLSKSFRTHAPLIDAFNDIFGRLLVHDAQSPVQAYQVDLGKPMSASRDDAPTDAPLIEMILIDESQRDEENQLIYKMVNGRNQKQTYTSDECRRWEAYEVAGRIKTLVEDEGRIIFDKETRESRPMRYDDVAILFRALTNINLYEDVFKAIGVPFVTLGGRGYYNRQEVWDLLNLLRALYNPADNLSLATALRSPLFGLSDDALLALRLSIHPETQAPLDLWEALVYPSDYLPDDERDLVRFSYNILTNLQVMAGRVTISELLRSALAQTGYLATLTGLTDGVRRRGNVEKLLDIAQSSGKITLGAFTRYLQDLSSREAREGDAVVDVSGAVTMMSVHASKGLEYPMIVLGDASWKRRSSFTPSIVRDDELGLACKVAKRDDDKDKKPYHYQRALWLQGLREDVEQLRLLYVAMTRAQDYLIVSGKISQNKDSAWKIDGWLGQLVSALHYEEWLSPYMNEVFNHPWGQVAVTIPQEMPPEDALILGQDTDDMLWDSHTIAHSQSLYEEVQAPLLLQEITILKDAQATHLAATHMEDIGGFEHSQAKDRRFYKDRFRRRILHDAPNRIQQVSKREHRLRAYQIGEIVHEVLRWWQFPQDMTEVKYREVLRNYAWRQGITDERLSKEAVDRAYSLLQRFVSSSVYDWLENAKTKYREIPFIYTHDERIIHGIIDTLFQRQDGTWVILDYKTSTLKQQNPTEHDLINHARRYHLQLGVYAKATIAQLNGVIPETYIHYIRYNQAVHVSTEDWEHALSRSLSERIVDLIEE